MLVRLHGTVFLHFMSMSQVFSVCYILTQRTSALEIFNDSALYKCSLNNNNNNYLTSLNTHDLEISLCSYGLQITDACLNKYQSDNADTVGSDAELSKLRCAVLQDCLKKALRPLMNRYLQY